MTIASAGIHVINGYSAAGSFIQAFGATEGLLVQDDVLSCGPAPRCIDLNEWRRIRFDFLREWFGLEEDEPSDRGLLEHASRLASDDVHVWAGTTVEDQLLIAYVVHLTELVGGDPAKIRLVQFEWRPNGKYCPAGMGIFSPEQMQAHPQPRLLSESEVAQYRRAWDAFTSDAPSQMLEACNGNWITNPYLLEVMRRLLRRYPQHLTGLGYWDWRLLANAQNHGPRVAMIIGHTMVERDDDPDWIGDLYLFHRLLRLGGEDLSEPLLAVSGSQQSMHDTSVVLTDFGKAVLDGRASFYPANPIDDWIGGVHLSSAAGNLWFLEGDKLVAG
jgi:hypothetical protein